MNLQQLAAAYHQVASRHHLPPMSVAGLEISTPAPMESATAWAELQAFAPVAGWLQFQSRVVAFNGGALPQPAPDWGTLLDAACHDAAGRSILCRSLGTGLIALVIATPAPGDDPAMTYLVDEVRHLATGKVPGACLRYRRYWRSDPDHPEPGVRPCFAALHGFAPQEDA